MGRGDGESRATVARYTYITFTNIQYGYAYLTLQTTKKRKKNVKKENISNCKYFTFNHISKNYESMYSCFYFSSNSKLLYRMILTL